MTRQKALLAKLSTFAVAMFVFAIWGLPPLYQLFCEVTGVGLQAPVRAQNIQVIDSNRTVRLQFVAVVAADLPLEFYSEVYEMEVPVGQPIQTKFFAENKSANSIVGQAIPNISPYNAVDYFHKTECFCFNQQQLAGGEKAELGLVFIVDVNLPRSINTITLSYTMFDLRTMVSQNLIY